MEKVEFKPEYFIEGSQKPEEEPSYWKFLRGEKVQFADIAAGSNIYTSIIEGFILRGEAVLQQDGQGNNTRTVCYLKERR